MSFGGTGKQDWLLQRASALYLVLYGIYVFIHLWKACPLTFSAWRSVFTTPALKIAAVTAIFAILVHVWIGIWTVFTDYVKYTSLRISLLGLIACALIAQGIWGISIVWSVTP